ncbi:E3 ubiquitin-protein ligase RNF135 [Elephas maximus indicus]|uniref:E3 ubiquitin-protein ligase RNF135 n=1 Tax=Elephas maximus indicus TaxID=99487 RepID=UPI002116569F|nr:E3 ubiquitin-protein ligase RNF135 [Elephas maximus indicus]
MAGLDSGPAIPVWLNEDDLGCIICRGLLDCPVTLPCGHSFCSSCLKSLWGSWAEKPRWACPTCREGAPQKPPLRKNTLLQDLADKYSRAVRELEEGGRGAGPELAPGPAPASRRRPAALPAAAQRSITEVGRELGELVEQLVDITRSLQNQRSLSQSEADNELTILGTAFSSGVDLSLASPKLVTSNTSEGKMRDVLHALEEIQEKLRENFTWKEAFEKQTQVELLETPSTSSRPLPDQNHPAPRKASRFAQWAIHPTFDLRSLSCSLEVSEDLRTVTVSHWPQSYPWSRERFKACQVLCSQALSSGQHYWEVDTQQCSHWAVGVASWEMNRDQILGRTRDSWCVEWMGTSRLCAWHMAKELVLSSDKPGVVGIWLDLEGKKLAFYAAANQEKLLYECEISASYPLHPAFWLYGLHPTNSLIIKQVKT